MARYLAWPARDRHVRREGEDYIAPFMRLLPQGIAWPREPESVLYKTCRGLAKIWGYVDNRAADLLEIETDPRKTTIGGPWPPTHTGLLPDWERAWGLPDPCFPKATTLGERQRMLVLYMTYLGAQSRAYFIGLMEYLGYSGLTVKEWAPFMAGISQVGETRPVKVDENGSPIMDGDHFILDTTKQFRWYIGPPEMRFYWAMNVGMVSVAWFRAASGQAGVDPHVRLGIPEDLQCLLKRWKPAHTELVFDFSQSPATNDPMYGTP
jgi:uncharacterized protein YmfQ (DUF2313 family)